MNFSYENQGHITYLSYAISPEDIVDTMSLGMITNNKIHGLAPSIFTQIDTTKYIKYNVSAKISVQQFFSGAVSKKHLLNVFEGIINAVIAAEDYMIDINSIVFDLNYIFADVSTCEIALICLPIQASSASVDLNAFFKNIMFSTQFDQSENCDYVAKIINYLNSSPVFSLEDFGVFLNSLESDPSAVPTVNPAQPTINQADKDVITSPKAEEQNPPAPNVNNQKVNIPAQSAVQPIQTPTIPAVQQVKKPAAPPIPVNKVPPVSPKKEETVSKKKSGFLGLFSSSEKKVAKQPNTGSAIPTQAKSNGFAIPGQKAPVQGNGGFAIPGQKVPVQSVSPVDNAPVSVEKVVPPTAPVEKPATPPQQPAYQPPVIPRGQAMNFGETTVLGGGNVGETTVLGAAPTAAQPKPCLIRIKNNEKINLDKPVFSIGKEKSYVDYFLGDNTAISRSHANIITRDGQYFLMDTNSTNHTYVNGGMIQSNIETQLSHGDKVRLANEDFEFKLY